MTATDTQDKPVSYKIEVYDIVDYNEAAVRAWVPFGSIDVEPKTMRRTALKRAATENEKLHERAMTEQLRVRLIGDDGVYEDTVEFEVPPPVLKIGGEAVAT